MTLGHHKVTNKKFCTEGWNLSKFGLLLRYRIMKRILLTVVLIVAATMHLLATHQRAAEITFRHVSGLTYEVRVITFTYTSSPADRPTLDIGWGDGTYSTLLRTQKTNLPDNISLNVYEYDPGNGATTNRHTYSSPGTYVIFMEDPNRNLGVVNIPNSVNVPMYVETKLIINPFLGTNNSPVLLNPPIDVGCVNQVFVHNPGAYDPDGDSLSFRMVNCKTAGGIDIPGFFLPQASNSFTINAVSGDVVWDTPVMQGEYNIAFVVEEWRKGALIGSVTRDMQIEILACNNTPPVIYIPADTCVTAGDTIAFDATAIDPDGDNVWLSATGGPFEVSDSPAELDPDPAAGNDTVSTRFTWISNCSHVRNQPFQVFFKASDDAFPVNLVSFKTLNIKVNCPAPENLTAMAVGSTIHLTWDRVVCNQASGYRIFRHTGYTGYVPESCETGVPDSLGYVLIHENQGIADTTFIDDNNGAGLTHGNEYCYMVTAIFSDGAESYPSLEACATLKKDIPVITHVSNDSTDLAVGHVFVAWSKPTELDTIQIPGPYQYELLRSEGPGMGTPQTIATLSGLDDTTFIDNSINLNNAGIPYSYKVNLESLNFGYIGSSRNASSLFLEISPTDEELRLSFIPDVPWENDYYIIFRREEGAMNFDSLGLSTVPFYIDTGLINGTTYCYYIKSVGGYSAAGFIDPIINFSQIACASPYDNVPPCPPELSVIVNCDLAINTLNWINPYDSCSADIFKYLVFYSPYQESDFVLIDSTSPASVTYYEHFNNGIITGCYAVMAVDSVGNRSDYSLPVCIDNDTCSTYRLPNVFTPNFDGYNDVFHPFPYTSVERVDMTIFNRWGGMVYETEDPDINWDGKDMNTNADCSDGVYFYVCRVYEITLLGIVPRELRGSVTIIRD